VQQVLDQVIRAVEFLFGFTLLAGLVVLFAAVTATREARAREFAVMRAMGAGAACSPGAARRAARRGRAGRRAGLGGGAGGGLGAGALRLRVQLESAPWVPLAGGVAGALLALAAGWWGLREVLRRPVVETLRRRRPNRLLPGRPRRGHGA
jgi:putative ABC transport system permease protein